MTTDDSIVVYLGKAEQALSSGDKRATAILINQVLKQDFSNVRAWQLLYRLTGSVQTFEDFQFEFSARFYPDNIHLLSTDIPEWLSDQNINQTLQSGLPLSSANVPSLAKRVSPIFEQETINSVVSQPSSISFEQLENLGQVDMTKLCPVCLRQINLNSTICPHCHSKVHYSDKIISPLKTNTLPPQPTEPVRDNTQPVRPKNTKGNDPGVLQKIKQKALYDDKFTIPIVITLLIFFVLFFAVPFIVWLIGFMGSITFFLWKMDLFPVNLLNSIKI